MDYFLQRLREPSTWAGLAVLGGLFNVPAEAISAVGQIVIGVGAVAAMALKEKP